MATASVSLLDSTSLAAYNDVAAKLEQANKEREDLTNSLSIATANVDSVKASLAKKVSYYEEYDKQTAGVKEGLLRG